MSLEDTFKKAAQDIVLKFSIGTHQLRKVDAESYNATTGTMNRVFYPDIPLPAARDEIDSEKFDQSFISKHTLVVIAGLDLPVTEPPTVPEEGDLIVTPTGEQLIINQIGSDQYGAAYNLYVGNTAWQ